MTIEEKAKAYDKVVEKIKYVMEHGVSPTLNKEDLQDLFPELEENDDDESKKWILEYLYDGLRKSDEQFKGQFKTAITWLEKQGEQKPAWSEEDEKIYQSIMDDTVQENQLNDKQTNWLRDIKYRYFPQLKQEWSEEDEKVIHCLEYTVKHFYEDEDTIK